MPIWKNNELCAKNGSCTKYGANAGHYTLKLTEKDYRVNAWGMGELYYLPFTTTGIHQCLSTQLPWVDNELASSIHVLMQAKGTLIFSNQGLCWHIASAAPSCYSIPLWKQMKSGRSGKGWAWGTCLGVMYRRLSLLLPAHVVYKERTGREQPPAANVSAHSIQNQCDQCNKQSIHRNEC